MLRGLCPPHRPFGDSAGAGAALPLPSGIVLALSDGGGQIQEGITAALLPQLHCCDWVAEACELCFGQR